ncbi:phosphoenolpyruvate carboxylase [Sphingobacterium corticibacterium]|uniref:Phosphoenolpyruvate carboxylase n=1 Tax=Sphingobacterium corticibacterium TaxID=2484746 RepID=A0A4Q6XME2_9SPHI|nr:phosphoenolpyruvate carboxylase [Sphingobacterium corticibacterium]RZF61330.1 phosphoenolpyruvate carboxylase [Sphingobacterium corticibacterium]
MKVSQKKSVFHNEVLTRFDLYKSLFLTLPFQSVKHTGTILPFFSTHCEKGVEAKLTPEDIIQSFFGQYEQYVQEEDQIDFLFRIVQYIERQVVLFDAVEDSAFQSVGKADDSGVLQSLFRSAQDNTELKKTILEKLHNFSVRLVLTAHPTQFYPGPVLAIITDLIDALKRNDLHNIQLLLQQLGKTPFINKEKPTPVDEAASLAWFLENVFYKVASEIQSNIDSELEVPIDDVKQLIELGFWPGGDRDGNPNVNVESTKKVASMLRTILFRCYYRDFRLVRRRITFRGTQKYLDILQDLFYDNSFNPIENPTDDTAKILENLHNIKEVLNTMHEGLFVELVEDLIRKVSTFGCYFTTLDIRQDSSVLRKAFNYLVERYPETGLDLKEVTVSEAEKEKQIAFTALNLEVEKDADALVIDTLEVIKLIKDIQKSGSERAAQRFIISNCQQASDILGLMQLFLWSGWKKDDLTIDFVPLFETVDDLSRAADVMRSLYANQTYAEHIKRRGNKQTIMLGFSDSTKDGGYLMANWSIYRAKIELTAIAREYDVDLVFFDGRGGPPARGGGKTQRFYASMGKEIANEHIQLTIQGQTISSQYGSLETAKYNIEQLLQAGIISELQQKDGDTLTNKQKEVIDQMAHQSHDKFMSLRKHPLFLKYLETLSPLKQLAEVNISSRPVKRNSGKELRLEDLRAISFVTSWSQLKQNIPGFYGVGTALQWAEENNLWSNVKNLYENSGMFKTMMDNCMMSMTKSNFDITAYMQYDETFGDFWSMLRGEFELTKRYLLKLSNSSVLMENYPIERASVLAREKIVLPLLTIQHYAIRTMLNKKLSPEQEAVYRKLIARTIYGVVNAGRNVA